VFLVGTHIVKEDVDGVQQLTLPLHLVAHQVERLGKKIINKHNTFILVG
jgi:hypothetical protein